MGYRGGQMDLSPPAPAGQGSYPLRPLGCPCSLSTPPVPPPRGQVAPPTLQSAPPHMGSLPGVAGGNCRHAVGGSSVGGGVGVWGALSREGATGWRESALCPVGRAGRASPPGPSPAQANQSSSTWSAGPWFAQEGKAGKLWRSHLPVRPSQTCPSLGLSVSGPLPCRARPVHAHSALRADMPFPAFPPQVQGLGRGVWGSVWSPRSEMLTRVVQGWLLLVSVLVWGSRGSQDGWLQPPGLGSSASGVLTGPLGAWAPPSPGQGVHALLGASGGQRALGTERESRRCSGLTEAV